MSKEKIRTLLPYAFSAAIAVVFLVPIINVYPEWDVFMHPWRPETAASLLLLVFLGYGWFTGELQRTILSFSRSEKLMIVAPMILFTVWSGTSALWANSLSSVIHHTGVWANYLGYYLVARWILARRDAQERFTIGLCVFVLLLTISPLIEFFTVSIFKEGGTTLGLRFSKYTELTNTIYPLVGILAIFAGKRARRLAFLGVFILGMFVVMSFSRTGVGIFAIEAIALAAAALIFPLFRSARKKAFATVGVAIAGILLATCLPFVMVEKAPMVERVVDPGSAESARIRPFFFDIGTEMFRSSPLVGVGADNFGQEFVRYRMQYAEQNPKDTNLALADDALAERAHNEYIQIAAELGVVGILIFGVLLAGIVYSGIDLLRNFRRASPYAVAAFIGLAAFLASSLVTSYSFRMIQNGVAFFIVLPIAVSGTIGRRSHESTSPTSKTKWLTLFGFTAVLAIMLASYSIVRIAALQTAISGMSLSDSDDRNAAVEKAIAMDPANATLEWGFAKALLSDKQYGDAALHFRRAINKGKATSIDYARMSIVQRLGGDLDGAEATIREALRAYPRSPFLYVRLAYILDLNGKHEESAATLNQAIGLDKGQSLSWWNFMTNGGAVAAKEAFDQKLPPLMELKPREAVYAIMGEREVLHPEEKMNIPGLESPFSNND
ncbi:MAG TPA: O-antigen ligase family protein [Pyrinomonadaceae bacterium]|nr:O-antigen ligase family protein [Pyrinomonadaceae bacterium]